MANKKITAMTALSAADADGLDVLPIVDISDVSNTATGETKKITKTNLLFGLASNGANSDITSLTGLTTALTVGQGGTGATTAQAAINALTSVSSATNEYVLTKDTSTADAIWKLGGGTVTSVGTAGTVNGITLTGTVTTSGTITLGGTLTVSLTGDVSGTLPVANGGTNLTDIATLLNSNVTPTTLGLVIGTNVQAYDADTAKTDVVQNFTAGQSGEVTALTDAATTAIDFSDSNNFSLLTTSGIGSTRILGNPSNAVAGQSGAITITSDAASRLMTYASNWQFEGGTAPAITTDSGGVDILVYYAESATRISAKMLKALS